MSRANVKYRVHVPAAADTPEGRARIETKLQDVMDEMDGKRPARVEVTIAQTYREYMREYMREYRRGLRRSPRAKFGEPLILKHYDEAWLTESWARYHARKVAERRAAKEAAARLNATASLDASATGRVSAAGHPAPDHPQHDGREEERPRRPFGPGHGPRGQEPKHAEQQDADDEQQAHG